MQNFLSLIEQSQIYYTDTGTDSSTEIISNFSSTSASTSGSGNITPRLFTL